MAYLSPKTVEIVTPKTTLTPCILDDDPAQLEMLSAVVADMGYVAITTPDPEEALKLVRAEKSAPSLSAAGCQLSR